MDISVFTDKEKIPTGKDLADALGNSKYLWDKITKYVLASYPEGLEEWNYPGKKYGWSFRIKDKKRAILYLLPREGFFKVAFVFGRKAVDEVLQTDIHEKIKTELQSAKVYAEGRGIRIDVTGEEIVADIKKLVDIKLSR